MTKPSRVRDVFAELRRSVGDRATLRELLGCAAALVELFDRDENEPRFELRTGITPLSQWALDAAFADGGWRVLGHEAANEPWRFDWDGDYQANRQILVRTLLEAA